VIEHCPTCGHKLPKPRPARRIECAGGCGVWWYQGNGRPRRWCDRCYPKHRRSIRKDCDPVRAFNIEGLR
jgi:hypothetical protein